MAHYHKIGLLSLFLVMAVINSNATDYSPHDYSVIPPSPEVSALMQDVEIPVSLFSGLPDIEIPICTVTEGTIEIPVTISYNGGGIKVEELPGIIGMGWHLNAGGCVSRSINGLPDELNTGEYGYHGLQHLNNGETTFRQRLLNRDPDISYTPFSRSDYRFPDSSTCQRYNNGLFDVENDLYRFNFNGHKGTFFINNDVSKSLVVSSSSPVFFPSITGTSLLGSGGSFSLGNDNGVEYYFNDAGRAEEKTLVKYEHLNDINWNSDSITTAWFLTKMKSAANDSIMFEYIPRKIIEYHGFSQSHIIFSSTNDYHGPQHQFTTSTHSVDYRTCLIKRISTPTTIVLFDYNNDTLLTSISLYRRTSPQELVKRWELTHSEITVGFKHNNNNTSAVKKPFLSSIVEKGATEQDDIVLYKFDYNTAITDYDQNVNYAYAQD
ncbi:MAG: hypothetical protein IK092_01135, partial [Muribaculaceae bacterium]|nr:hypothetical protein [Muribaculaceae bacterium]